MIRIAIAAAFLAFMSAGAPLAALTLKQPVTAASDVVLLGDFFADGGQHAEVALFRAPKPGASGTVNVVRLQKAVRQLGIGWTPPLGVRSVEVTRPAKADPGTIALHVIDAQLRVALADTLAGVGTADNIAITLNSDARPIELHDSGEHQLSVVRLDVDPRRSRFNATLEITGTNNSSTTEFSGRFETYAQIPVLSTDVNRGEVITQDHLTLVRMREPDTAALRNVADIVGMAARRRLREGAVLGTSDVEAPKIVGRNQLVTITFQMPGIVLTTQGRSLGEAAIGEVVSVLNVRSNRIVQAVAMAPGRVSVAATPTQFAMR